MSRYGGYQMPLSTLRVGETTYTVPWAMDCDAHGKWFLNVSFTRHGHPAGTAQMRVERRANGWHTWATDYEYWPREGLINLSDRCKPVARVHGSPVVREQPHKPLTWPLVVGGPAEKERAARIIRQRAVEDLTRAHRTHLWSHLPAALMAAVGVMDVILILISGLTILLFMSCAIAGAGLWGGVRFTRHHRRAVAQQEESLAAIQADYDEAFRELVWADLNGDIGKATGEETSR